MAYSADRLNTTPQLLALDVRTQRTYTRLNRVVSDDAILPARFDLQTNSASITDCHLEVDTMKTGQCRLCHRLRPLQRSHVIPDAVFRRLFKRNQGKAITFSDADSSWTKYSSDSWWEHLLCKECEESLNNNYEQYSISLLRNSLRSAKVQKGAAGVHFSSVDTVKLQLFVVSMMWRAAISSLPVYAKVQLPPPLENEVRLCLMAHKKVRSSLVGIRMSRLIDKTPDGFSFDTLKNMIVSPLFRDHGKQFSFCFLIEGFFLEIFVPGLKLKERIRSGFIGTNKHSVFANYLDIFEVPELVNLLVSGYGNDVEGRSKIKRQQRRAINTN